MARKRYSRPFQRAYARTRVIVKRVRSYRRPRLGFIQKNKTMILVGLAGGLAWIFRDKIKALLPK